MPQTFSDARITHIINETATVKRFYFEVLNEAPFVFSAGQFVMLDLPIQSKITTRSYSIASAPNKNNTFELCVVLKEGGLGTTHMWEHFKVGHMVKVSKPLGKFLLPEVIDRDICFVCTGTGIAPFIAMLQQLANEQKAHKNIYLVAGNRFQKDILYKNELLGLTETLDKFQFISVLSREDAPSCRKGYVHAVYEDLFSDKRSAYFYICGWHDMLHETRRRLEAMGYGKDAIKFESYD